MSRQTLAGLVFLLPVCLPLAAGGVADDPAPFPATPILTDTGVQRFHIADPQAAASAAWRDNSGQRDKDGGVPPPTPGYELSNRVIVRTGDGAALAAVLGRRPGVSVEPVAGLAGFWLVEAPSVAAAVELAAELAADPRWEEAYLDLRAPTELRAPSDPAYPNQWHLNNTVQPLNDVNAEPAWDLGYTGAGVVIGILEGGWQYDHPDLAANFNAEATQPGGSPGSHGTSCAGVAGAVAYNDQGVVGLAYGAQVSGQIYGTASQTAAAFLYRNDLNAIKSNSWGPSDNGMITYLNSIERAAIEQTVSAGRAGRGTILVWAAGNGGTQDRVEYDPYASSRYTLAIGAIGDWDVRASYNERGSSMLAVAQSSGNNRSIYTTTAGSGYTPYFGGTSAASPLAAGVIALMLQANPELTWRDVQHVIVHSARQCDPANAGWTTNGAGHLISYDYGFGALDAEAAAVLAATWQNVRPEVALATAVIPVGAVLPDGNPAGLSRTVQVPHDLRLESVELVLNVQTEYVGDLRIALTSPSGTTSVLAEPRYDYNDNYVNYIFTSLRHWDEPLGGTWTVTVADEWSSHQATWQDFQLRFYGTHVPGDLNCDARIDIDDIDAFVKALVGPDAYAQLYPDCDATLGDLNGDGRVNFDDIDPFAVLLAQQR